MQESLAEHGTMAPGLVSAIRRCNGGMVWNLMDICWNEVNIYGNLADIYLNLTEIYWNIHWNLVDI